MGITVPIQIVWSHSSRRSPPSPPLATRKGCWCSSRRRKMNPNKRPPPSSSTGTFEGGDATKRARDHPDKILRPGQEQPGNVLLVRVTDIVHPVSTFTLRREGERGTRRLCARVPIGGGNVRTSFLAGASYLLREWCVPAAYSKMPQTGRPNSTFSFPTQPTCCTTFSSQLQVYAVWCRVLTPFRIFLE